MKEIVIKTQQELDALPAQFQEYTRIYIQNDASLGRIILRVARDNSSVVARDNSSVVARDNSSVEAWGNSSVVARDNSSVVARDNSSVVAWDNSSVVARDNSSVVAWDNSSVEAWGNSSVVARGNSSVVAWDNSSVEAWDNSSVVAWDNSSVEAWGNVGVHLHSDNASVLLYMFAVCWALAKGKVLKKKCKTATIIKPKNTKGTQGWLDSQAIKKNKDHVILFKRVSSELKTQEGTDHEAVWEIGKTLSHPAWSPKDSECGAGKFHACSRPYFCDQFRSTPGDKYLAIQVSTKDLYAWDGNVKYPHKIAFREGTVLYECDRLGKKKETQV